MSLRIGFVTDYVCPYCIVAKKSLTEAAKGKDVVVEYIPFELTREPGPQVDTYHDEARREKYAKTLQPYIDELHLDIKVPPAVSPRPYTRMAFEGYYFAKEHGKGSEYNDRVYEAYFRDELDIGKLDVLCTLAGEVGLDKNAFCEALTSGKYTKMQEYAAHYSRDFLGVKGVPAIYVNDCPVAGNFLTKEDFEKLIDDALAGRLVLGENVLEKDADLKAEPHMGCSENGCGF